MFINAIKLHSSVWRQLNERRRQLPHALLFLGQKGLGKYELAHCFANSLLCESPLTDGAACKQCLACNWFDQGNHPDFRLLQPDALADDNEGEESRKKASLQITVDQVRGLDEFVSVGTHRGGLRIILINPAESMNRNAANSLLKTLEEPNSNTLFLLISSEPMRLLPTIRSRCQVLPFPLPPTEMSLNFLEQEGIADPVRWLALAGGSPGIALELASSEQNTWLDLIISSLASGQKLEPLACAAALEKILKESKGKLLLRQVVDVIQKWLIDLNQARNGLPVRYFQSLQPTIAKLADMIPSARLIRSYRNLILRRQESEQPLNSRLFLEGLFMDYRALFAN